MQFPKKEPFLWLYHYLSQVCKKRKISFGLTFEELKEFTKTDKCHYCGGQVKWFPHSNDWRNGFVKRYNLDRKTNSVGYTKENCVVCCGVCNAMKSDRSKEEFIQHVETIYKYTFK